MAVYSGVLQSIAIDDTAGAGLGSWDTIGGVRNTSISITNDIGETTTKDSATQREFDATSFLKSTTISFSGLQTDTDGYNRLKTIHQQTGSVSENFQFTYGNGDVETGYFSIVSLSEEGGNANEHGSFSCELQANGAVS